MRNTTTYFSIQGLNQQREGVVASDRYIAHLGSPAWGLLLYSPLRYPNIVARAVLDHIHHLVGLTNDVMGRFGVVRIGGESHRSPHIQIQSFFLAETAGAQTVAQSVRNNQRLIFPGLWKQNYKLVSTVAERKID